MFQSLKKTFTMRTILVLSCCVLLGTGLPAPAADDRLQEIKLSQKPDDCKTDYDVMSKPKCYQHLLQKYGYEEKKPQVEGLLSSVLEDTQAIRDFQEMYDLPITGIMDELTAKKLNQPRCSVEDKTHSQRNTRKKRWTSNGSKWASTRLTWCIDTADLSPDMDPYQQIEAIRNAFKMWADVSQLTFVQEQDCRRAVIRIKFAVRDHGDYDPFDGPDGTLAHAFFPRYGGDAHFDDDEFWSLTTTFGGRKLFVPIATHEFGHSLGLGHSADRSAIMYAYYFSSDPIVKLQPDDIDGIQALYGKPQIATQPPPPAPTEASVPTTTTTTTTTTRQPPVTALCFDAPEVDAMVMLGDGYTYGFSGSNYWRMDANKALDQIPLQIGQNWFYEESGWQYGMPGDLDAVLFWPNEACSPQCQGNTYFFKGRYVYHTANSRGTGGTVTKSLIRDLIFGMEDDIDAATIWTGNDKAYLFKDTRYWRIMVDSDRSRDAGYTTYKVDEVRWPYSYPRPIDQWWDLGWDSIDSAVYYWHYKYPDVKKTYFFKQKEYVRYNDVGGTIDSNYPKLTEVNWYGCSANANMKDGENNNQMDVDEMMEDFDDNDVMEFEEIDIRTGMEMPPEDDASSANITKISLVTIVLYFSAMVLL